MEGKRPGLAESAITTLLFEIKIGRINIDAQDRMNRQNSNYPSSLELAKTLLQRTSESFDGIKMPEISFQTSSEIYNYLFDSLKDKAPGYWGCGCQKGTSIDV